MGRREGRSDMGISYAVSWETNVIYFVSEVAIRADDHALRKASWRATHPVVNLNVHDARRHRDLVEGCTALSGLVGWNGRFTPGDARGWFVVPHSGRKIIAVIGRWNVVVRVMAFLRCPMFVRGLTPVWSLYSLQGQRRISLVSV